MTNNSSNTKNRRPISSFREGRRISVYIAFCLGLTIIGAAIILGKSPVFIALGLLLSFIMTVLWSKNDRAWISLLSMSAATPLAIARYKFNCNLIFALWFVLFNPRNLLKLPKWIYIPSILVMIGVVTSSINWMSDGAISGMMRQGAFAFNMFLGPFLLLPVVYLRMRESQNHEANLKGLLFFLIIPSTALLASAKLIGNVANAWEASMHAVMLSQGFFVYKLGNVFVGFMRTEVGFILAALICASSAIAASHVKNLYRLIAVICLTINSFLLLSTASFGSGIACFCGLAAIFYTQILKISASKVVTSVVIMCTTLILAYVFAPQSTKTYVSKRFEYRVTNADTDRLDLWKGGLDAFLENPGGVGFTLIAGDSNVHNDYIVYAISYGFFGGIAYALLVVKLLISFLGIRKNIPNDPAALAVYLAGLGVLVALSLNSITDHSNSNRWYFNVIWSIIWYCYFCSYPVRKVAGRTNEKNKLQEK